MGGEKLKISALALLFLGAGLFVQIPNISAQEVQSAEGAEVRDPRAVESSLSLDEDAQENPSPSAGGSSGSVWIIFRMILVLAFAAAAIYGVVYFIKRSSKKTDPVDPFLKVLANAHLGSNRYAHIVAVGSKAWLLGSSDGGVNLIGEIEDKDVINAMLLEDSAKLEQTPGRFTDFLSILRRLGAPAESRIPSADDIRKRRERLKGL